MNNILIPSALGSKPRHRAQMQCEDCGVPTASAGGDYYMLHDRLWRRAAADRAQILCLDCVEARIGRRLFARDFRVTPLEMVARMLRIERRLMNAAQRQREFRLWRSGKLKI